MAEPADHLPRWLTQPDGRLIAFDPDQVHRGLFAATEKLGQPDPFLARELTDSVLHFLAAEADDPVSTGQINDLVVKVVRELGQPALAQAFPPLGGKAVPGDAPTLIEKAIEGQPDPLQLVRELAAPTLREYSLRTVYGPELAAAHQDGLLILTGLDHPCELAAAVLERATSWTEALVDARARVGGTMVLDGPEFLLAESDASHLVRELTLGLRTTGLKAVVNLNQATPPLWAQPAVGPLYAGQAQPRGRQELDRLADQLLDSLPSVPALRVDWHLGERDFRADQAARLLRTARRVTEGQALALVFDRPRGQPALAEGIDRRHPFVLLAAGLNLPALAARSQPAHFLRKVGSLARLAISAGVQKRDFLRRSRPGLTGGFVLDRARLVIVPVGLDATARLFHGKSLGEDAASLGFGRQVLQELSEVIGRECSNRQLESCLDSPIEGWPKHEGAGLTPTDTNVPPRQQLQAAGRLQAITRSGTACLRLPAERRLTADEFVDLLRYAWQHTEVVRIIVQRVRALTDAAAKPWAE